MSSRYRRLAFACVVLAFACVVLWSPAAVGPDESVANARERVTAAMAADIDEFASRILATGIVPGMSLAVVTSEGIAYSQGYGLADVESQLAATPDTQFYIASTTKALTALAGALLHDRGQLDLDAPLSDYLPNAQMHPELSPRDISLRDLLTMTHGIASIGPVDIRAAFTGDASHPELQALLRHHPPAENGREFRYGNLGYNVFSLVLEDRFPGGWKQIVRPDVDAGFGEELRGTMEMVTSYLSRDAAARNARPQTTPLPLAA